VIVEELRQFDPAVASKPQIVAANKIDALDDASRVERLERHAKRHGLPFVRISGVTGAGVDELLGITWRQLAAARTASPAGGVDPNRTPEELASRRA
jgi:GTP-binding protein